MRVCVKGQLAQRFAQALVAVFVWSALLSGAFTVPAGAQIVTRAATATQSVAVLPFQNSSGYQPETFGATAAAEASRVLRDRLFLDVYSSKDVTDQMATLGMVEPLTYSQLTRLCSELDVNMALTGQVREAKIVMKKGDRRAEVTLGLELFDRISQAPVNGALVTVKSPSSQDASADELIQKALEQAVFQATQEMKTRPTVTARVIWASGTHIFTNSGTRDGLMEGMEMVATRGGERIALVKIIKAQATGSDGEVEQASQLRTGDLLRAVYHLPGAEVKSMAQRAKAEARSYEKPAMILGAVLALAGISSSGRSAASGRSVGNLKTSNPSNQLALPNLATGALMAATGYVTWTAPSTVISNQIVWYEIYRGGTLVGVNAPSVGDEPYFIDQYRVPQGVLGCSAFQLDAVLTQDAASAAQALSLTGTSSAWVDPDQTYTDWLDSLDPVPGWVYALDEVTLTFLESPPIPGESTTYRVRPLIFENHAVQGVSGNNYEFVWNTEFTSADGRVTFVAPPAVDQALVVGSTTNFLFYAPTGADEMVLQVQRESSGGMINWVKSDILQRTVTGIDPNPTYPPGAPFTLQTVVVNNSDMLALSGSGTVFWWRVGARRRGDAHNPRPWPLDLDGTNSTTDEYDWVWSYPIIRLDIGSSSTARAALVHQRGRAEISSASSRLRGLRVGRTNRPMHTPR